MNVLEGVSEGTKLLLLVAFSWVIAVATSFEELLFLSIPIVFLCTFGGERFLKSLKFAVIPGFFLLLTLAGIMVSADSWKQGLRWCGLLSLRYLEITVLFIAVLSTSSAVSFLRAIGSFGLPGKLGHLLFFGYTYFHTLSKEYERLFKSAKCRGFAPCFSLKTYRTYAFIFALLLLKSFVRAERTYKAMLCRGFMGSLRGLSSCSFTLKDLLIVIAGLLYLGVALWKF